jgi:putrescine aminotransferase
MAEYPDLIRDVRGRGLLIGMELSSEGHAGLMMSELIKRGVVVAYTLNNPTIIRLEPPLIIQRKEVDMVIDRLGDALLQMKKYGI